MQTESRSILRSSFKAVGVMLPLAALFGAIMIYSNQTDPMVEIRKILEEPIKLQIEEYGSEERVYNIALGTMPNTFNNVCAWRTSYGMKHGPDAVELILRINFVFDPDLKYTKEEKDTYKMLVKHRVENIWNNKFWIEKVESKQSAPCKLVIKFSGKPDKTVLIHGGKGQTNMGNWYVDDDHPAYQAHEIGHMFGLYDEYKHGATARPNPLMSKDGLMGDGAMNKKFIMFERYYDPWLAFMGSEWKLIKAPEHGNTRKSGEQTYTGQNGRLAEESVELGKPSNVQHGRTDGQGSSSIRQDDGLIRRLVPVR